MKSIEYAEKRLGSKMKTPEVVASGPRQPIKYDVENLSEQRISSQELGNFSAYVGKEVGDCEANDEVCKTEVMQLKQGLYEQPATNTTSKA